MQCVAPWKGKIKLMDSFEDAWKVISDYCKSKITDIAYNTWISRIHPVDLVFDFGSAFLLVPNDFHAQTLRRCYMSLLNEGFEEIFGTKFNIEFRTPANAPKKSKPSAAASITTSAATAPLLQSPDSSSYEYTFDTFIVGSSNKFAHAACLAVATNPSHAYTPLFLYGNSGLGKTHLLYAIGNEIKKNDPSKVICYIKGDDFTVELVESLRLAKMNEFRQKYRQADILLVDDVQFIGGKESTQEEFFHTFVSHSNLACLLCQQLVSDTGVGILFLYQCGNTHHSRHFQRRTTGIATYTDSYLRAELLDDAPCFPLAPYQFQQYGDVLPQMFTVKSGNG